MKTDMVIPRNISLYAEDWAAIHQVAKDTGQRSYSGGLRALIAEWKRFKIASLRDTIEIEYDERIGEYVATALTGDEVFGSTRQTCYKRLREANRIYIAHCQKSAAVKGDSSR